MATGAHIGVLGDADVVTDGDVVEVIQLNISANPGVVADGQLPGPLDSDSVPYEDSVADLSAEDSQQTDPESIGAPYVGRNQTLNGHPRELPGKTSTLLVGPAQSGRQ